MVLSSKQRKSRDVCRVPVTGFFQFWIFFHHGNNGDIDCIAGVILYHNGRTADACRTCVSYPVVVKSVGVLVISELNVMLLLGVPYKNGMLLAGKVAILALVYLFLRIGICLPWHDACLAFLSVNC